MSIAGRLGRAPRWLRFLATGASTTAFSYLLYLLLLQVLSAKIAYVVAYVAGIVWSYSFSATWVFGGRWTWRGLAAYPLVYLLQAGAAFALFSWLVDGLRISPVVAPLAAVVLLLPLNFLAGRWIVYHTSGPSRRTGNAHE